MHIRGEYNGNSQKPPEHLIKIFGRDNVLVNESASVVFSTDSSQIKGKALAVVFPKKVESIRQLIVYANRINVPVVVSYSIIPLPFASGLSRASLIKSSPILIYPRT